jgi:hypothetical protein
MSTARRGRVTSLQPSLAWTLVAGLLALACLAALAAAVLGGVLLLIAHSLSLGTF